MTTVAHNDRELLELAAKAAGIKLLRIRLDDPLCKDFLIENSPRNQFQKAGPWSPLADDGDALRLAVSLGMDVDVCRVTNSTWAMSGYSDEGGCAENHADDPGAATRRAIVRAAAEIARNQAKD
jgi:hypothetical protein